jgi:hypothetical protein
VAKRVVAATPGKAVAKRAVAASPTEFDDLSNLAGAVQQTEDELRAQSGSSLTWLRVIQPGAEQLTEGTAVYIRGAKAGDFLITEKNILLKKVDATVLGFFKVYTEKKPGATASEMDATVGFWLSEDAEQIPLGEGNNFKRYLTNGNYLAPTHWVFLYLHDHPELEDVLMPFQSIGNVYYKELVKMIKGASTISAEIRLSFGTVPQRNEEFKKTNFYPKAEVTGKNFDFVEGKVALCKGGLKADEIKVILTRAGVLQKSYMDSKLVSKRSPQQLLISSGAGRSVERRGLPGSAGSGYEEEAEGAAPRF